MASVLIPIAEGSEELEAVTIIDLLVRAEINVVSAGLESGPVKCSRGTLIVPDMTLEAALRDQYDMIVLPGGLPGADHLQKHAGLRRRLQEMSANNQYIAAICAAPKVLASAGLLDNKSVACYPGALDQFTETGLQISKNPIVQDGNIITSRGPGTAMDFALYLIEVLTTPEKRQQVEQALKR